MGMSLGGLSFLSYSIYIRHVYILAHPSNSTTPWIFAINGTDPTCWRPVTSTIAIASGRVEPPDKTTMFGMSLNWQIDNVTLASKRMGGVYKPVVFNSFITLTPTDFQVDIMNWQAQQVGSVNGIFEITLQPSVRMSLIPDATLQAVAKQMAIMNGYYGVPVILRYGHEMNGAWMPYGQHPTEYIASFRALATYVHAATNMTAMMWAPNAGLYYPYGAVVNASSPDFAVLDSNNDGAFNVLDDPYLPYFPGAGYVDWVGLSMYQYHQNSTAASDYLNANVPVGPCFIRDYISGTLNCQPRSSNTSNRDFYTNFAVAYNKPFALPESGSAYATNATNVVAQTVDEVTMKTAWWTSILTLIPGSAVNPVYPLLKLVVNFEEAKAEAETSTLWQNRDYRISYNPSVVTSLTTSLFPPATRMLFGSQLSYQCGGQVLVTKAGPSSS
ncbi:hypothetical protein SmJEL517_g05630 [Synchytrium microbalum]|uniref:GH26 domain-containing protein n=1 Tax=Synchytrium microbalum TaxID=1806994 RepID=A0A507BVE4_9FUNG|nr:uncharacterized protein SmJEL517_g05630 [Synchytrium microbalum]TPX30919.1 hypothetical protein SmJEL517_g05630 [Synchytrium microbalum]